MKQSLFFSPASSKGEKKNKGKILTTTYIDFLNCIAILNIFHFYHNKSILG